MINKEKGADKKLLLLVHRIESKLLCALHSFKDVILF